MGAWSLDPSWVFLNHGSFGARLHSLREHQRAWQDRLDAQPLRFFLDTYRPALAASRWAVAEFLGGQAEDLVLVPNATYGVNSVLAHIELAEGDEVLVLDQAYGACRGALDIAAERAGARVVEVALPLPCPGPDAVLDALLAEVGPKTRLAMVDAVTSPTAMILPVECIVEALRDRGVETIVDAAHSPGFTPINLDVLGAAYTTGNLHKWICAPLGAAFLHVRKDKRDGVLPASLSHGARPGLPERFSEGFDWTGTFDPSAWLSIPYAIEALGDQHADGIPGLMARNRALARRGAELLEAELALKPICPPSMRGAMAAMILPMPPGPPRHHLGTDPLQRRLIDEHRIEVPVLTFAGRRLLRISAQAYNTIEDYRCLANALKSILRD